MNYNFAFNTFKYNFWEIYECIIKYYPIGLRKFSGRGIYYEYPGLKELERIVTACVHDEKNFEETWKRFDQQIAKKLNKTIEGTTYGQAPSFSSTLILEKHQIGNITHTKELHFAVSLLGNFYQIYGVDIIKIFDEKVMRNYTTTNLITVSPYEEFKEAFEFVEKSIQKEFPKHKFVPLHIGQSIINGLQVRHLDDEICTINMALFNHFLTLEDNSIPQRGDRNYGYHQWKI